MRHPTRFLFAVAFALCGTAAAAAATACPTAHPKRVLQRFVPADCVGCWQRADAAPGARDALLLDWVVPSAADLDAPLAAAALSEAAEHAGSDRASRADPLPAHPALRLRATSGLPWNGYVGLQFEATRMRGPLPKAAAGWLALVERVPAGEDGTPVERQLVRIVVGPLPLAFSAGHVRHLSAVKLPANARAERLGVVAWATAADAPASPVLAAAQDVPAGCPGAPKP